jgi:hypothetical protein
MRRNWTSPRPSPQADDGTNFGLGGDLEPKKVLFRQLAAVFNVAALAREGSPGDEL